MKKDIEEKVIRLLESGEALQSSIYRALDVSKSRVSEVLKDLEERNIIRRQRIGKNYVVSLNSYVRESGNLLKIGIIRSSEYGYIIPLRKIIKDKGYELEVRVYESGVEVMKDLVMGKLDFGISPAISQIFFAYAGFPVKMIAPAGSGGGYLFSTTTDRKPRTLSSRLSTMEMILRTAVNSSLIRDPSSVDYFDDPMKALNEFLNGKADAITVWEPFATILRSEGKKETFSYSEMEHYCCTLSAHSSLKASLVESFRKYFFESMNIYEKNRSGFAFSYSALLGLPYGLVERTLKNYTYHHDVDIRILERQLSYAGISVPSPSVLRSFLLES